MIKSEVCPLNDARPHASMSQHCPCKPVLTDGVLIHNAFDGRDRQEEYDEAMNTQGKFVDSCSAWQLANLIMRDDISPLTFSSDLVVNVCDESTVYEFEMRGKYRGRYQAKIEIKEL